MARERSVCKCTPTTTPTLTGGPDRSVVNTSLLKLDAYDQARVCLLAFLLSSAPCRTPLRVVVLCCAGARANGHPCAPALPLSTQPLLFCNKGGTSRSRRRRRVFPRRRVNGGKAAAMAINEPATARRHKKVGALS